MRLLSCRKEILRLLYTGAEQNKIYSGRNASEAERAVLYECGEILRCRTGLDRAGVLLNGEMEIENALADRMLTDAAARAAGEPLAYVLGYAPFCGEDYIVKPGCLIPRADTEVLVEEAVRLLPANGCFWDLCTGSGCVAAAILKQSPDTSCIAVEISPVAAEVAAKNFDQLGVSGSVTLILGDALTAPVPEGAKADYIVSNPPYIPTETIRTLDAEVRREPKEALDGGADGMNFYRKFLRVYAERVREGFLFEIGWDQGGALLALAKAHCLKGGIRRDYGGRDRVVWLRKS